MARWPILKLIEHLRRSAAKSTTEQLSDVRLIQRFAADRDEARGLARRAGRRGNPSLEDRGGQGEAGDQDDAGDEEDDRCVPPQAPPRPHLRTGVRHVRPSGGVPDEPDVRHAAVGRELDVTGVEQDRPGCTRIRSRGPCPRCGPRSRGRGRPCPPCHRGGLAGAVGRPDVTEEHGQAVGGVRLGGAPTRVDRYGRDSTGGAGNTPRTPPRDERRCGDDESERDEDGDELEWHGLRARARDRGRPERRGDASTGSALDPRILRAPTRGPRPKDRPARAPCPPRCARQSAA